MKSREEQRAETKRYDRDQRFRPGVLWDAAGQITDSQTGKDGVSYPWELVRAADDGKSVATYQFAFPRNSPRC